MTKKKEEKPSKFVAMAAIDPYVVDNIIEPTEKEVKGQDWVQYGDKNIYPNYLFSLYKDATTLHTLIDACADYITGDKVRSNNAIMDDVKARDLVKSIGFNLLLSGGVFLNVLRNKLGQVAKIIPLDFRNVRSDKKHQWFFYSEDFGNKSYGRGKYISYPAFSRDESNVKTSIFYYTNSPYTTYALPCFVGATKACEIEKKISTYHLNNLNNNFSSNYIVSFNNGIPTDEMKEEIEEMLNEKFSGVENAGRPMVSFSADKEHSPEILKLDSENWGDKYNSLKKDCRQEIFTAFRCTPNLLGIPTETSGFNTQEYASAFKIFNRSVILPYQKTICSILDEILGMENSVIIDPYSIDFEEDGEQVETITSTETIEK